MPHRRGTKGPTLPCAAWIRSPAGLLRKEVEPLFFIIEVDSLLPGCSLDDLALCQTIREILCDAVAVFAIPAGIYVTDRAPEIMIDLPYGIF